MNSSTKEILASNLQRLLNERQWSNRELSRRCNGDPSDRYIGMLLGCSASASVEIIDQIAKAFDLKAWQILMPHLPERTIGINNLDRLIVNYCTASEEGRKYIDRAASTEAASAKFNAGVETKTHEDKEKISKKLSENYPDLQLDEAESESIRNYSRTPPKIDN